jgi:hypothetical protein
LYKNHFSYTNSFIYRNDNMRPTFIAWYCQEIDLEAMKVLNLCYERAKEVCMLDSSMKDW